MAVVAVILVMMGWRSALVVGAALPLSALMVLSGLRFLGIPLHQMSVMGLIIAMGLLIDNAIVIVDEVRARLREGVTALTARTGSGAGRGAVGGAWYKSGFSHQGMLRVYRATLDCIFKRPVWGIALAVVLPIAGFIQARKLPEQFFPPADRDQFHIELELPPQASLARTLATVSEARRLILAHPEV